MEKKWTKGVNKKFTEEENRWAQSTWQCLGLLVSSTWRLKQQFYSNFHILISFITPMIGLMPAFTEY